MANIKKLTGLSAKMKKIDFIFTSPIARSVMLAGTFNNWDYKNTPLEKSKDNTWRRTFTLRPGRYEYKFVVDGSWTTDPNNRNRVKNSLGTENSIIEIR